MLARGSVTYLIFKFDLMSIIEIKRIINDKLIYYSKDCDIYERDIH